MGSRRALYGALCVNVLIHHGLRRMRHLRCYCHARGIRCASGLCPAFIRSWSEVRRATLATNSEQGSRWNTTRTKGGFGDCERREASPQALRERLKKRTRSALAAGFAATVIEPFRSGKRVRARITAYQAPFRKGRGTPCGCASLRGALTGRAHARYVRNVSLCPSAGQPFRAAIRVLRRTS